MIKDHANAILSKEMDRKDFLKHVGVAVAAVAGVSAALSSLNKLGTGQSVKGSRAGYGSSSYGG